jgi:D-3-phosphoglycerate dehydrogenase / 2-oxoglutarate reductase
MKKVLITDDVHPLLIEGLEWMGYTCFYEPKISNEKVHDIIGDYEGLIINSKILVDKAMLDTGQKLLFVGRVGSGMEIVDKEYAAEKGVAVLSSPEGNRNAVAEHALGMLLSFANHLNCSNAEVKNFIWQREKNRGFELMGKTIGIIGFGHTGRAFSRKLMGMGMNILTYDKYLKAGYTEGGRQWTMDNRQWRGHIDSLAEQGGTGENWDISTLREVDFQTIKNEADIISFHLPLTAETRYMANADFFNDCKKNIILLNTSRGNVVKTVDLIAALEQGKIQGACLDVFENEKTASYTEGEYLQYEKLFSFDNVIVSPHVAGWTHESKKRLALVLLKKIEKAVGFIAANNSI